MKIIINWHEDESRIGTEFEGEIREEPLAPGSLCELEGETHYIADLEYPEYGFKPNLIRINQAKVFQILRPIGDYNND